VADVHHMIDVTSPGDHRRYFCRGAKIDNPTKIDRIVFELRELGDKLDTYNDLWGGETVHEAADHLLFLQRAIAAAIGRLEDINRG
jgi:hypothetical protein